MVAINKGIAMVTKANARRAYTEAQTDEERLRALKAMDLDTQVEIYNANEELANRIKKENKRLADLMMANPYLRKQEDQAHTTMTGRVVKICKKTTRKWKLDKLKDLLSEHLFRKLCPRSPNSSALGKELEKGEIKGIKRCVDQSTTEYIKVTVPKVV